MRFSPQPYFQLSLLPLSLEISIPRTLSNSGWVQCTYGRKYPWNYSKHMQPRNIVRYGGVFASPIFLSESKVLWSPVDPASSCCCWIIPLPSPPQCQSHFLLEQKPPRSSQEFEPRLFYLSPCQFPLSSFYRAYTALISSPNDNTLHIYDRSRGNQKTAGNNFLFLSFEGFLSKVFSDFFQKFFPSVVATFRIVSRPPFTTQSQPNATFPQPQNTKH